MKGKTIRRVGRRLAISWAALVMCPAVSGQDDTSTTPTPDNQPTTPAEAAPEQPALPFPPSSVEPLPEGQIKVLTARVIDVKGTAQWRPSEKDPWKGAEVNDLLYPGAQIRTATRSSMTLWVGENATVMVCRSTQMDLPVIVQEGDVLRTHVALRQGRAEYKVHPVGLTNDIEVLTPTTVLAVRGTGFAVTWGALEGVEIDALAANVIHAIEVRYLLSNLSYYLSGAGATRENQPDPVQVALGKTVSRPIPGGLIEGEFLAELQGQRRVDYSRIGLGTTLAFVSGFEPPPLPPLPPPPPPPPPPPCQSLDCEGE